MLLSFWEALTGPWLARSKEHSKGICLDFPQKVDILLKLLIWIMCVGFDQSSSCHSPVVMSDLHTYICFDSPSLSLSLASWVYYLFMYGRKKANLQIYNTWPTEHSGRQSERSQNGKAWMLQRFITDKCGCVCHLMFCMSVHTMCDQVRHTHVYT